MSAVPEIEVDLGLPPGERWAALKPFAGQIKELAQLYASDFGGRLR